MRLLTIGLMLVLTACAAHVSASSGGSAPELSEKPLPGNDARRDGFYDGGTFDPDLRQRDLQVPN